MYYFYGVVVAKVVSYCKLEGKEDFMWILIVIIVLIVLSRRRRVEETPPAEILPKIDTLSQEVSQLSKRVVELDNSLTQLTRIADVEGE